ncbi:2', 3'-cyclic nucleotide 2'-phosphodiesterase [Microterricola viridarii]|uniref:2', 3'-cyclic nucleotide 2'-phosphodiesterase n=1 Tax=Microterricola viridarii TaxID=412690 RepID=A0A109QZ83_9MICO|nr:2', 3'-cyclic nucleotide 2'-phosphodiesterase [Microterricola viridarii]
MRVAESALAAAFSAHDLRTAPAALAAVFDRNGLIAWRGVGEPRRNGVATERDTVFRIASMSKSFLAATALGLRDDGLLDLDRAIAEYVPGARFLFDGSEAEVTLRQLLSNCSGMPEDNAWGDRMLGASREEIALLASDGFRLTAEPGERYQYSNLGMSLVGRAIEAVTGRTIEHEVARRFLEPLGLVNTRYRASDYLEAEALARGYRTFDGGTIFAEEPYVGSGALACIGALFSTLDDVAAWASFLASAFGEAPTHSDVLAAASRRELQRVHTVFPIDACRTDKDLSAQGYGMGLVVEHDRRHGRIVQHSGGLPGFSSHMRWHAQTGLGVVVFGNSDEFGAERLASRCLPAVLAGLGVGADLAQPWPEVLEHAATIDAALRADEPLDTIAAVFADNVLLDLPADIRKRRVAELLETLGAIATVQAPLGDRTRNGANGSALSWGIQCERGTLLCEIQVIGLKTPLVQAIDITALEIAAPDITAADITAAD